ncbi:MAG: hypothetical protein FJ027_13905 [Candidatus Rokubacteria bacterium]|nr:hypothetical protein [Candidatus Rokubacteria bacterium]
MTPAAVPKRPDPVYDHYYAYTQGRMRALVPLYEARVKEAEPAGPSWHLLYAYQRAGYA